jgi:hypothetical protein
MVVFRREGLRMVPWYLLACLLGIFVGLLVATFLIELLPIRSWSLGKALFLIVLGFLVFPASKITLSLMGWVRDFRTSFMTIHRLGVRLRIPGTTETSLGWPDVTGVRYEKRWMTLGTFLKFRCRLDTYTISTTTTSVTFSLIDIPAPKRAAREIASRIGSEIISAPVR